MWQTFTFLAERDTNWDFCTIAVSLPSRRRPREQLDNFRSVYINFIQSSTLPESIYDDIIIHIYNNKIIIKIINRVSAASMQMTMVASACLIMLWAIRSSGVSGHAIVDRDHRGPPEDRTAAAEIGESRALDLESIFAGFAKSMISRTAGATSSQVL